MVLKDLQRIPWTEKNILLLQQNIYEFVSQFKNVELLLGRSIKSQLINTTLTIDHKLQRTPSGWIITNIDSNANVWMTAKDDKRLYLQSSASVTVDLWVY